MDIDNDKFKEALAEVLDISLDTIEKLNLTIEDILGEDEISYGFYVEYPKKCEIDENILSSIEQEDINKIPWGTTQYYSHGDLGNTRADPFGYFAEYEAFNYYQKTEISKENILEQLNKLKTVINN